MRNFQIGSENSFYNPDGGDIGIDAENEVMRSDCQHRNIQLDEAAEESAPYLQEMKNNVNSMKEDQESPVIEKDKKETCDEDSEQKKLSDTIDLEETSIRPTEMLRDEVCEDNLSTLEASESYYIDDTLEKNEHGSVLNELKDVHHVKHK